MPIINIDGVIGYEVTAAGIREQLVEANGKDITVNISTPGGYVSEGLAIYNELKNYKGTVDTHLMGFVASMGTYISLVGGKRTAEKNAMFMIHNASSFAWGDHREMLKEGKVLDSISNMIAKEYSSKTGVELSEIRTAMDDTTYYFGDEIMEAGFVHEIVGGDDEDKDEALALAQMMFEECNLKMSNPEVNKKEMKMLSTMMSTMVLPASQEEEPKTIKQEAVSMDLKEMKEKHPDLCAQIEAEGREAGVAGEKARVKTLTEMRAKFPKAHSQKVIDEAILEGHDFATLTLNLMSADQVNGEVEDAKKDEVTAPSNGSNVPEMVNGEMATAEHLDSMSEQIAKMPGVL